MIAALVTVLVFLNTAAVAAASSQAHDVVGMVDEFIEKHADETAGVAIAVVGEEGVTFQKSYGYADIENMKIADDHTLYEWGPVSKLLVCIAVMQLHEQGKLNLEADIMTYLPNHFLRKTQFSEPITMIHLLNNTAGWQDVATDMRYAGDDMLPDLQSALQICEPLQIYAPGTTVAYSNYGIALAGYVVERISGIPFYEYVADHIFAPLSMNRSSIHPKGADNDYVFENQSKMRSYSTLLEQNHNYFRLNALYPCESAIGSFDDMVKFLNALVRKDANLLEKTETWALMFTPTLYYDHTAMPRNAHGFWAYHHENVTYGHGGTTLGFSCQLAIDVEGKQGIVIMVNQPYTTTHTFGLANLLLGNFASDNNDKNLPLNKDIEGYYVSARTISEGFFRIYDLLNVIIITPIGENEIEFSYLLSDYTMNFRQVQPNIFAYKDGFGVYNMIAYHAERDTIQAPNWDLMRTDKSYIVWGIITFIALLIAMMLCLITFIWSTIRILGKNRKRILDLPLLSNIVISAAGIGFGAMLAFTVFQAMNYTVTRQNVTAAIAFNIVYIVLSLGYFAILFVNKKRAIPKIDRVLGVFSLISCVCISFFIMYWKMYIH